MQRTFFFATASEEEIEFRFQCYVCSIGCWISVLFDREQLTFFTRISKDIRATQELEIDRSFTFIRPRYLSVVVEISSKRESMEERRSISKNVVTRVKQFEKGRTSLE